MAKLTQDEIKWILSVDAKGANKEIASTSSEINKLASENKYASDKIKEAEKAMKEQTKVMEKLKKSGNENSEEYRNAAEKLQYWSNVSQQASAEIKKNNDAIEQNKEKLKELNETMDLNEMSMKQLRSRASDLQKQLDVTSKSADPKTYDALEKELGEVRGRMSELRTTSTSLIDDFAAMDNPVGMATRAVQGFGTALKALIANPIGVIIMVIVGAFLALKAAINSSEEASAKFQQVLAPFRVLMDIILNVVQQLVKAFLDLTLALMNWVSKAAENIPFIGGKMKELNDKAREGVEIEKQKYALKLREREALVENAQKETEIARLRNEARQREKYTNDEIIEKLETAMRLENEIAQEKIAQAKIKLEILELETRHAENVEETNDQIAQQTALIYQLESGYLNSTRRMVSEINSRKAELRREDEAAAKAAIDNQVKNIDFALKEQTKLLKQQLADSAISQDEYNRLLEQKMSESLQQKLAIAGLERDARMEIEQQILDAKIEALKLEEQFQKERDAILNEYRIKSLSDNDKELDAIDDKYNKELESLKLALDRGLITKLEFAEMEAQAISEKEMELSDIKRLQSEEQAEKELQELIMQKETEKMLLQEAYNDELLTKEEHNQALLELDIKYNQLALDIESLSLETKKQLQQDALDSTTKTMEEETKKLSTEQKKRAQIYMNFADKIGETLGHTISGNESMVKSSLKSVINMALDALEAQISIAVAGVTAQGLAQSMLNPAAMAKAAIKIGLIKAAFSAVKAVVNNALSSSTSSKDSASSVKKEMGGTRQVIGRQSGGYLDVSRAQDGKKYKALVNPNLRGYVNRPTILVGDGPAGKSREWVASNDALQNPTIAPIIELLNQAQNSGNIRTIDMNHLMRANMAGFQGGGYTAPSPSSSTTIINNEVETSNNINKELVELLRDLKNNGIPASVSLSDLQRKQDILELSRKIGSK